MMFSLEGYNYPNSADSRNSFVTRDKTGCYFRRASYDGSRIIDRTSLLRKLSDKGIKPYLWGYSLCKFEYIDGRRNYYDNDKAQYLWRVDGLEGDTLVLALEFALSFYEQQELETKRLYPGLKYSENYDARWANKYASKKKTFEPARSLGALTKLVDSIVNTSITQDKLLTSEYFYTKDMCIGNGLSKSNVCAKRQKAIITKLKSYVPLDLILTNTLDRAFDYGIGENSAFIESYLEQLSRLKGRYVSFHVSKKLSDSKDKLEKYKSL